MKNYMELLNAIVATAKAVKEDNCRANRKALRNAQKALRHAEADMQTEKSDEAKEAIEADFVKTERRRRMMTAHKNLNKMPARTAIRIRKEKHTPPAPKAVSSSMSCAQEQYERRILWENHKAKMVEMRAKKVPEAKETDSGAEKLVRKLDMEETRKSISPITALNANMAAKIAKIDKAIADVIAEIDGVEESIIKADIRINAEFVKADQMVTKTLAYSEKAKGDDALVAKEECVRSITRSRAMKADTVKAFVEFRTKSEKTIDGLKNTLMKLVEKKDKLQAKTAEHLKKAAEAKAEADTKRERDLEHEELRYLFRYGEAFAEDVRLANKAVTEALEAYNDVDYRYERTLTRYNGWQAKVAELKPQQKTLKMKRTKLQKKYAAANEAKQAEIYKSICQLNADTNAVIKALEEANSELCKAEDDLVAYALAMPELKAEADKHLADVCARKQEILALAKSEMRRVRLQDDITEAFEQRYERGEYVPEKEDAQRYKVRAIPVMKLYAEQAELLKRMNELVAVPEEERKAGWLQEGKQLFQQFAESFKSMSKFTVDAKDCVVNNVSGSAMSDIMGVKYGSENACKEMVLVNYDTNALKVYWNFAGDTYKQADERLHKMRVYVVDRLLREGLTVKVNGEEIHYDMLSSSNSQQKKGQAYMGETETMKRTEELREFGLKLEKAIECRPDNAPEWLKRNATLTTPSKIYKDEKGHTISIRKVLMVSDVEIDRIFDNVTTVDGKGKSGLHTEAKKALHATMFDGQGLALKKGIPSSQMRGPALKFMLCALPEYKLPEYAIDIMGRKVRVADYDIMLSKSCWKAAKMGMNWQEYVDMVTALAEKCEGYDLMRSVRYSDREIGDEENPRNLARQATQQWVTLPDDVIEQLTRKTRNWLKNHKRYWTILSELGEWDKPVEERSAMAKLFNKVPQLVMHPYIKQWLETSWNAKRDKACSGRIRTKGQYPYIVQDPIAMIQIMLEGKDPNGEGLGVIAAGFVNLPKVSNGRKVYAIRYPANYIVGMVLEQINVPAFANLGNVAVISYYGDTIVRADGDFDGDEMLFIFDQIVIETMERIIREYKPSLIDFPHVKVACNKPFGDKDTFITEIASALVRAQEYNLVGRYSNLAVRCLHMASLAKTPLERAYWLNYAKYAHVGAILCLDLVKGGVTSEVKDLLDRLEGIYDEVTKRCKMPWNQIFSHRELTMDKVMPRSLSTQDRIAGAIFDDAGAFAVEFDEGDTPIEWNNELFRAMWPDANIKTTSVREWIVPSEDADRLHGCRFEDENDKKVWSQIDGNKPIGLVDWLILGWHNSSSILWKMTGADMAEKRNELDYYIRKVVMDNVRCVEWISKDGYIFTLTEKYASLVKNVIRMAFGVWIDDKTGEMSEKPSQIDNTRKGSLAMFVMQIFAQYILAFIENDGIVSDQLVEEMTEPRPEQEFSAACFFDEYDEDLAAIMDDGTFELSVYDEDGCPIYDDEYPAA